MLRANDTQEDVMSERNKDLVRRYYDQVINGRDLDAVGDYFADERTASGVRKGCFYFFRAFPDLHVSLDELLIMPALIDTTSAAMPVRRSITALSPRPLLGTNQLPGLARARTLLTGSDGASRLARPRCH
jgi:hypothetical protein